MLCIVCVWQKLALCVCCVCWFFDYTWALCKNKHTGTAPHSLLRQTVSSGAARRGWCCCCSLRHWRWRWWGACALSCSGNGLPRPTRLERRWNLAFHMLHWGQVHHHRVRLDITWIQHWQQTYVFGAGVFGCGGRLNSQTSCNTNTQHAQVVLIVLASWSSSVHSLVFIYLGLEFGDYASSLVTRRWSLMFRV